MSGRCGADLEAVGRLAVQLLTSDNPSKQIRKRTACRYERCCTVRAAVDCLVRYDVCDTFDAVRMRCLDSAARIGWESEQMEHAVIALAKIFTDGAKVRGLCRSLLH